MCTINNQNQPLSCLVNLELVGITFVRDYIQFLFDDPLLNTYTLPKIKTSDKVLIFNQTGYYDLLCSLIGKVVINAFEDKEKIIIFFTDDVDLIVSLKLEDRIVAEAAMLRLTTDGEWHIW